MVSPRRSRQVGSSPLARGLRQLPRPRHAADGIIPARAGFTPGRRRRLPDHRDHPRSRGVYLRVVPTSVPPGGSSPLARGLLHHEGAASALLGIIPARAGFTFVRLFDVVGIIPARAGFTRNHRLRRPVGPDHPRSRGVYSRRSSMGAALDHPRSRGVYRPASRTSPSRAGSSPLARGLPGGEVLRAARRGIIPARAGFTRGQRGARSEPGDHPRSRGVYPPTPIGGCRSWGSSPLARGLHGVGDELERGVGIIPARAGFTLDRGHARRVHRDHPRSRGVYYDRMCLVNRAVGSSPLARGLLRGKKIPADARGIIPARAGFT